MKHKCRNFPYFLYLVSLLLTQAHDRKRISLYYLVFLHVTHFWSMSQIMELKNCLMQYIQATSTLIITPNYVRSGENTYLVNSIVFLPCIICWWCCISTLCYGAGCVICVNFKSQLLPFLVLVYQIYYISVVLLRFSSE